MNPVPIYTTREEWLTAAANAMRAAFDTVGRALPVKVRVACGWPSKGATARTRMVVGQCWIPEASADGTSEVCVSPVIDDPREVFAILVHELIHASGVRNHRGPFLGMMRKLGLAGKPTATEPGDSFDTRYGATITALGTYPHAKIIPTSKEAAAKQTTRMLKCVCSCGYTVRTTRKWAKVGMPSCVCGRGPMTCADPINIGDEGEEE